MTDELLHLAQAPAGRWTAPLRRLASDARDADDAVQDAWLAACRCSPRDPGRWSAWFARITRNALLERARGERRRRTREAARAPREAAVAAEEIVQRRARDEALARAVLELPEPYREALVLRYFEELPPREIARRLDVPTETARTRVKRGLARLRVRLEQPLDGPTHPAPPRGLRRLGAFTGLAIPRAGLAAAPEVAPGLAPALWLGGSLMAGKTAVTVLALSLGLATWWLVADDAAEPAATAATVALEPAPEPRPPRPAESAGLPAPAPAPRFGSRAALAPSPEPAARSAGAEGVTIGGVVVDSGGRPVAGATLRAGLPADASASGRDPLGETDASGRFDASVPRRRDSRTVAFTVRAPRFLPLGVELGSDERSDALRLVLLRRPVLHGEVRTPDGTPLAAAAAVRVLVETPSGETLRFEAVSDLFGGYRIDELPVGTLARADARSPGLAPTRSHVERALEPEGEARLDLSLGRGVVVTGRVVDGASGAPLAGAEVSIGQLGEVAGDDSPSATTDAGGRFRIEGVAPEVLEHEELGRIATFWIGARLDGFAAPKNWIQASPWLASGAYEFEVVLHRADSVLEGRVVIDATGEPASAGVVGIDGNGTVVSTRSGEDGRFRLERIGPGSLELRACRSESGGAGGAAVLLGAGLSMHFDTGDRREVTLRLAADPDTALSGRVVDARGRPVAGVGVVLDSGVRNDAAGLLVALPVHELATRTDTDGRFRFEGLVAGTWFARVDTDPASPRRAYPDNRPVELAAGETLAAGLDFVLQEPARFAGTLVAPPEPPSELVLELWTTDDEPHAVESTRPGPDGAFAFPRVEPARYRVRLRRGDSWLAETLVGPTTDESILLQ